MGFEIGEDRKLADYDQIVSYFKRLARASDRVRLQDLGKTTLGNDFYLAIISSAENLARLEHIQRIQARLGDPRKLTRAEAQTLARKGKAIVQINCTLHSDEVGASQMSLALAHQLATGNTETIREILENVVILLVPAHNPDGQKMVVEWYRKYVGTKHEAAPMPWLYHKYVGHDNNRDWFMFTQKETRLTVERILNVWRPQIVVDMHEMGNQGARMFVPPYIDPVDPNVDPILQASLADLGAFVARSLTAEGKRGLVFNAIFDAWTPARAYPHYHGGVRFLTEVARCDYASPVVLKPEQFKGGRGYDASLPTWNHPAPWKGGEWRLGDIIDYDLSAAWAVLRHAARNREQWIVDSHQVLRHACETTSGPFAYVVPAKQWDTPAAIEMLQVLEFAGVEVHRAPSKFMAEGQEYPGGTYVVFARQPFGAFARTMLSQQHYPETGSNGALDTPYDVTAHTLPIQMGVDVIAVDDSISGDFQLIDRIVLPPGRVRNEGRGKADKFILDTRTNNAFKVVNEAFSRGWEVRRFPIPLTEEAVRFAAGSFMLVPGGAGSVQAEKLARKYGVDLLGIEQEPGIMSYPLRKPRVGLYKSWVACIDEGWTRWVLEEFGYEVETLSDNDVRLGDLKERFDAVILPDMIADSIIRGYHDKKVPAAYRNGIGEIGVENLKQFVEQGGSLIALDSATELPIRRFWLPVRNVLHGVPRHRFYAPGSLLRIVVDNGHHLAYGMPREAACMFRNSPTFEAKTGAVVARYPERDIGLSGFVRGEEEIAGRAALVESQLGAGRIVLIGFRAQHRAQARGSYKFLFNAIVESVAERAPSVAAK